MTCDLSEGGGGLIRGGYHRNLSGLRSNQGYKPKNNSNRDVWRKNFTSEWSFLMKLGCMGSNGFFDKNWIFLPKFCHFTYRSHEHCMGYQPHD